MLTCLNGSNARRKFSASTKQMTTQSREVTWLNKTTRLPRTPTGVACTTEQATFVGVFQASEGRREANEERSYTHNGGLTRVWLRGKEPAAHICYSCQDGCKHFSGDTHNFPNSSPSFPHYNAFSATEISANFFFFWSTGRTMHIGWTWAFTTFTRVDFRVKRLCCSTSR